MRVRLYKKTKDNLSYFQFLSDDDQAVLNSQGYTDKEARNNGVRSVITHAPLAERYERNTTGDGKQFFILRAANGQEIARSVEYDSTGEMETAIAACIEKIPLIPSEKDPKSDAASATSTEENPYVGEDGDDNYKPLAFYEERIKGTENGFDTFATEDGSFYFTLNLRNRIVLISESYTSQSGRDNGTDSVRKNLPTPERYQLKVHPNGKHYFNLLAGNNQEIATSVWFDSEAEMNEVIIALQRGLFGATEEVILREAGEGITEGIEGLEGYRASIDIVDAPTPRDAEPKPKKKRKKRKKKESEGEKVYLKSGSYLFNDVTYQTMRSTNGKYYFSFRNADGKSLLLNANVRGFDTEEDVDAAVQRVLDLGPYEGNYEGKTTRNGKYYFYLKDTEGKNVAKSFFYDTAEDMQDAVGLLIGRVFRGAEGELEAPAGNEAVLDDYLPCERYAGEVGFHRFFNAEQEEWYFAFNRENTSTLLRSEGYTTEKARENGINSVIKNAPLEERWVTLEEDGKFYFALRAGNNQEIARSCPYDDAASRDAAWVWIRGEESIIGAGSEERDGVRWSAAMIRAEKERVAKKAAKPERKEDDYLACKEYDAHIDSVSEKYPGFITFEQDGEYYFAWVEEGKVVMRSEGYTTESARNNGIESVIRNRDTEERYRIEEKMNRYFVVLKAGNHQEITRSCPYDSRDAAAYWLPGARAARLAAPAPVEREVDDYLACKEYEARIDQVSEKYPDFITFEHEGEYFFAWVDDGKIVMRSERYTTERARDNGIESVIKNREIEARFSVEEKMDRYFLILKAGNGQEIARSCPYKERAAALFWLPGAREARLAAVTAAAATLLIPEDPKDKEDDYLKCEEYRGRKVNDKQNNVALFKHENGLLYFAVYNPDGSVRIRSEGFTDAKVHDEELSGVLKNIDKEEMYEEIKKGKYRIKVLKDETGREVGRSCLEKEGAAAIIAPLAGAGAAAAATAVTAAAATSPPPPPPATKPTPTPPVESSGGFKLWWLLPLLLIPLLWLMFRGCDGCGKAATPPPVTQKVDPPAKETPPPVVTDTIPKEEEVPPPPPPATCDCRAFANAMFSNVPTDETTTLTRLGTNPEFGNSHSLDAPGFYNKLKNRHETNDRDRRFLDQLFRAMGYENGFADANAGMFSETRMTPGVTGYMGYSAKHRTTYARLNTSGQDLEAFRIEAANGCHMNFMKTCGNHFFVCEN